MALFRAALFSASFLPGLALSLLPSALLEQPANSTDVHLQQIGQMAQLRNITGVATELGDMNLGIYTTCDGFFLGAGLIEDSCKEILARLDKSSEPQFWGRRDTGPPFTQNLPQRSISTDGTCVLDADLEEGKSSAVASNLAFAQAAFSVFGRCVVQNPRHVGGTARNVSGDESLYALMTNTFDASHVRCSSSMTEPGIEASCRQIVDTMPAGDEDETWFGPAGPGVDVVLPKTFISSDSRCAMRIQTVGPRDHWTWLDMYSEAVAIVGMCVRQGKAGASFSLGAYQKLTVEFRTPLGTDLTSS